MPSTAAVNCLIGRVSDRATITASTAAHSIAISPTSRVVFLIASAGAMKTAFGSGLDDRDPLLAREQGRRERHSARPPGLVRHDLVAALRASERRRQRRKVRLPVIRPAELAAEFARRIGMNEIVALGIDDIELCAGPDRRQDVLENPAHIDVENENAEWLAVRCENRSSDAQHGLCGGRPRRCDPA